MTKEQQAYLNKILQTQKEKKLIYPTEIGLEKETFYAFRIIEQTNDVLIGYKMEDALKAISENAPLRGGFIEKKNIVGPNCPWVKN